MVLSVASYGDIIQNKTSSNNSITVIDLQNKCTHISEILVNAFPNLVSVINAKNVKTIDEYAFDICPKLMSIQLDDTIEYIGRNAFDETSISSINIPSKIQIIQEETFINCSLLQHVVFSKKSQLIKIDNYAFSNCISLKNIKLPKTLKTINKFAFTNCINLQKILIPKTIDYIADGSFYNCKKLKQVIFY